MNKNCRYCGIEFDVRPSHYDEVFYCSKGCMAEDYKIRYLGKNNPNYSDAGKRICVYCSKEYYSYNKKRKYCSGNCAKLVNQHCLDEYNKSIKQIKYCAKCGILLKKNNHKYCELHNPNIKETKYCKMCNKQINGNRTYCSRKCRWSDHIYAIPESRCTKCGSIVYKYFRKYCDECWRKTYMAKRGIPRRVDANQAEIINALRMANCDVIDCSSIGGGFPDLLVGRNKKDYLIEVKNPKTKGKLNKLQMKFIQEWQGKPVAIVYTVEEALRVVGVLE